DHRPRLRVGGRFAGKVSSIKLREGGVDVVEVERDECRYPFVDVDLDDAERLGVERLGSLIAARESDPTEGEALATGSDDGRCDVRRPKANGSLHVGDLHVSA